MPVIDLPCGHMADLATVDAAITLLDRVDSALERSGALRHFRSAWAPSHGVGLREAEAGAIWVTDCELLAEFPAVLERARGMGRFGSVAARFYSAAELLMLRRTNRRSTRKGALPRG